MFHPPHKNLGVVHGWGEMVEGCAVLSDTKNSHSFAAGILW